MTTPLAITLPLHDATAWPRATVLGQEHGEVGGQPCYATLTTHDVRLAFGPHGQHPGRILAVTFPDLIRAVAEALAREEAARIAHIEERAAP